jgi:cell division protein FtsQ
MNGGGRVAEPLSRPGPARTAASSASTKRRGRARPRSRRAPRIRLAFIPDNRWGPLQRFVRRFWHYLTQYPLPRGAGLAAAALIIASSAGYGAVRGGHVPELVDQFKMARDAAANAAGFRITGIALSGHKHLTREEILAIAGVSGRSSLLFIDVADARARLKTNPWIAEATVQKLYPDRLQISITEREAFALWQKEGRVGVIADDGTVLEPYVARRFTNLPLFVGAGAERAAKDFVGLLARYPDIRSQVRASVLVAERRWNLRLKNGVDVRLPEADAERALDQLTALDRDKKLLSKDVTVVDLRFDDRVTVRLSDAAAAAREEALKAKKPKKEGGA